jgi:hypothetical protein
MSGRGAGKISGMAMRLGSDVIATILGRHAVEGQTAEIHQ